MLQQKQAAELDLSTEVATRLNLVDRETPGVSPPDTYSAHTAHTRHSDEDIPWLTKVGLLGMRYSHCVKESMDTVSFYFMCLLTLCVGNDSRGELCSGPE